VSPAPRRLQTRRLSAPGESPERTEVTVSGRHGPARTTPYSSSSTLTEAKGWGAYPQGIRALIRPGPGNATHGLRNRVSEVPPEKGGHFPIRFHAVRSDVATSHLHIAFSAIFKKGKLVECLIPSDAKLVVVTKKSVEGWSGSRGGRSTQARVVLRSRIVLLAGDGRLLLVRQPGLNTGLIKASRGGPRSGRVFRDVCNCGGD
jgi:hypothetical protein